MRSSSRNGKKKVIFNAFKVLIEDQSIFDEFDKFDKLRKEMIEEDFQGVPEEPEEPEEPEDDEDINSFSEEEKAIRKRYGEWQKQKKR